LAKTLAVNLVCKVFSVAVLQQKIFGHFFLAMACKDPLDNLVFIL